MFASLPPGWTLVTDSVETAWVEQYGNVDFVRDVARPVLALPPGFPAYTAVLHRLHINGVGRRRWLHDGDADPWAQMEQIQKNGIGDHWFVADVPLSADPKTSQCLADVLEIGDSTTDYTVRVWNPPMTFTLTNSALSHLFRQKAVRKDDLGRPNLWFPHTREWVANAPYDMGCTYIASDLETAARLLSHPRLEALPCKQ